MIFKFIIFFFYEFHTYNAKKPQCFHELPVLEKFREEVQARRCMPGRPSSCFARGCTPVQVVRRVAHAVDACVAGEVLRDRRLQRRVVAARQRGCPAQAAADHVHRRLAVHLHTVHASTCTPQGASHGSAQHARSCHVHASTAAQESLVCRALTAEERIRHVHTRKAAQESIVWGFFTAMGERACQVGVHVAVQAADVAHDAHAGHDLAVPGEAGVHLLHACSQQTVPS